MKKMSKGMLMTALICGAVYLGGSPVYASELQEFSLDEYVVTAARTETKLVDTPANISVVDAQTIEERHYQDVSEVLKDVPGANVLDTGMGAFEKAIKLNGDERVLFLIDGRRLNSDLGLTNSARASVDMNQLPDISMIERIEILKGAGGALYGSEAVGGVINIITKKADKNHGKVSVGYGSMGSEDYSATYSFKKSKTGIVVSAARYTQDYYKYRDYDTNTSKRWTGNSDYENNKVSLKIEHELSIKENLTIGYDYSKFKGTSFGNLHSPHSKETDLNRQTDNLYAKYSWSDANDNIGYLQVYHNQNEYNNYNPGSEAFYEEKTYGLDGQQEFILSEVNKMVIGASYRKSDINASGPNSWSNTYDESVDNLAFFINDIWEFMPSWNLNTGIRYDNHSEAGNETTFSAGLNKKFDDISHAYINWGQVFRAPTSDDLFMEDGFMHGNKNLDPESGETWTIGYATKLNEKTDFNINYFESDLKDAIKWDPIDKTDPDSHWTVYNIAKQEKKGMEVSVNHKINDNVNVNFSYTYLKIKQDVKDGLGLLRDPNAVPNTYRIGLNFDDNKWSTNLYMRLGSGASSESYLDSNYVTVDCAINYRADKNWTLYAKGYNLFNEAYAEIAGHNGSSYNYPAQSRRFIVGAEYKF